MTCREPTATAERRVEPAHANGHGDTSGTVWRDRTRLVMTPIAAPSPDVTGYPIGMPGAHAGP